MKVRLMTFFMVAGDTGATPMLFPAGVGKMALMTDAPAAPEPSWLGAPVSEGFVAMHRIQRELGEFEADGRLVQMLELEELGKAVVIDGNVQLAESDEHIYHEMFVHPAMTWCRARNVLVLGGADGCLVRELLKWRCLERVLVLEPDFDLVQLVREHAPEWTSSFEDPRVELVHRDVSSVLQLEEEFDLILADVELDSRLFEFELLEHVQQLLSPGGLFVAQTGGIRLGRSSQDSKHVQAVRQLDEVFEELRVAYEYIPSFDAMWTITVASSCQFCDGDYPHLSSMWGSFDGGVWDDINIVLDDQGIFTAYYDGITHMRLFSPPVDQGATYGWELEQGELADEPCEGCGDKSGNEDEDDEGRAG